ncbi:MAG: cobalamin-dependent protein, partial [Burkholderiales bacterium]
MTDLSERKRLASYKPAHKVRIVSAASLFDGHDASINIMRRILQSMGAEVIHLGHNRSVEEIVTAALQEDAQGIAVSSYQGGHVEFFKYMLDLLRERGGEDIRVFGGGGGVIVPAEVKELHGYGVARLFSPEDGQKLGLQGMIGSILSDTDIDLSKKAPASLDALADPDPTKRWRALSRLITALELGTADAGLHKKLLAAAANAKVPALGITGTGGAGKSSLTDELVRRIRLDQDDALSIAVISIDPSRKKSGGALLGDRIRMNAINPWSKGPRVFMRSLATREAGNELSKALPDVLAACKCAGFDLVIVETSGIGQGDTAIVQLVDASLYVMTPEYGAASQLEKIDMLDFADFVAINKFDRKGAADALRDVSKQVQRNRQAFGQSPDEMPVFGTMAARFNDDGVTALYQAVLAKLKEMGLAAKASRLPAVSTRHSTQQTPIIPPQRSRYLAEISEGVRGYKKRAVEQARIARERQQLMETKRMLAERDYPEQGDFKTKASEVVEILVAERDAKLEPRSRKLLEMWPKMREAYGGDEYVVKIRGKEVRTALTHKSLSGSKIRKVSLPKFEDHGEQLRWLLL